MSKTKDVYDELADGIFDSTKHLVKIVTGFHYPKLLLLMASIILAYYAFSSGFDNALVSSIDGNSLPAVFIAGVLYSFGFTSAFAVGLFVTLDIGANAFWLAIIGGLGSTVADLTVLHFIRANFQSEFNHLRKTRALRKVTQNLNATVHGKIKQYMLVALAGIFIASPLPDELGVSLLAGFTHVDSKKLAVLSLMLNTIGIWILLQI